jgi:hypothetical protein
MVKGGRFKAQTKELTDEIRADPELRGSIDLGLEDFSALIPYFQRMAYWNRRLDRELNREPFVWTEPIVTSENN